LSLSYRKRGEFWYVRGTVRVGREVITVAEHNTGCRSRTDAEAVGAAEEARIRSERLDGPSVGLERITIADAATVYITRQSPASYDIERLIDFTQRIGHYSLAHAERAWQHWLSTRGAKMAPATQARWRAILQATINAGAKSQAMIAPTLSVVKQDTTEGVVWLRKDEQERLLEAYAPHVQPIALTLCFQGLRSAEALRLDWRHVDLERKSLFVAKSKSGRQRSVPLHSRVHAAITDLWKAQIKPREGRVFLNRYGLPYTDTAEEQVGGNPIAKAHATACRRAEIVGFSPHAWRHHWASWMVMTGCDLITLMRLGGWQSPKMVQRYAAVSADHMAESIARLS